MVTKKQESKEEKSIKDDIKKKFPKLTILTSLEFINFLKKIKENMKPLKKIKINNNIFDVINMFLLKKVNKEFSLIINKMSKDNIIYENENIIPTVFNYYIKDKDIKPFWTKEIQEMSDNIFMPTDDNLRDPNEIENKKYITLKNTWFHSIIKLSNKTHEKINFKKNISEVPDIIKSVKIKIFFSKEQRKVMNIVIGTYRYFYNKTIQIFNNYDKTLKKSWFLIDNKNTNSKIFLDFTKTKIIFEKDKNGNKIQKEREFNIYNLYDLYQLLINDFPEWLLIGYPTHLIRLAIKEAYDRITTNFKVGKKFKMKFKSKKENRQTINLEKIMINKNENGFFTNLKYENKYIFRKLKTSKLFKDYDFVGSTLTYHKILKTYMLNLSYNGKVVGTKNNKICAIDLGTTIFATVFSENSVEQIGIDTKNKINKMCLEIDKINSLIKKKDQKYKVTSQRKKNLIKAMHRKIKKIDNLITELHWKTINYLTETYSQIIISPFETQKMVKTLRSEYARKMNTLSFYKFKLRLISKCKEKEIGLIIKNECYTSITCTKCGHINSNGFCGRTYKCNKCKNIINRDYQGARNALLKNIKFLMGVAPAMIRST